MNWLPGRRIPGLLVIAIVITRATFAQDGRDPLVRVEPAERPALRELVSGEEFERRYADALAGLGELSEWEQSRAPVLGMRVRGVFPNGPVAGSIEVGDVFARIDGQLLWCDDLPDPAAGGRRLEYYSASSNRMQQMQVEQEQFGVQFGPYWQPELLFLRGPHRNPEWDELALVAAHSRGGDPDLAETALARAVAAGLPRDSWTAQIGAEIALIQNRPEAAADFAWFADQELDPDGDAVNPLLLFRVALANYHLLDALRIVQLNPDLFQALHPAGLQSLIDLHRSRPEEQRVLPPPSVRAEAMYRDDLIPRLRGHGEYATTNRVPALQRGDEIKFDAPTAHYSNWSVEPPEPVPDMDLRWRFAVEPVGSGLNEYLRWFVLRLFPATSPDAAGYDPLFRPDTFMVAVDEFEQVQFQFGNTYTQFAFGDPSMRGLTGEDYSARIIRIGGQAEVFLNGHRIYYGPTREDVPSVYAHLTATGSAVTLKAFDWDELIDRP